MKIMTAQEAAKLIKDNDTVTIGSLVGLLVPAKILKALEERFEEEQSPKNITVFTPIRAGSVGDSYVGLDHFGHEGFLKRLISATFMVKDAPRLAALVNENKVETYSFSMGMMFHMIRAAASGEPGVLTDVGLHTFVDPRYGGGKINAKATEDLIELVTDADGEHLFYPKMSVNVAIIRGTTADEDGNISMEKEPNTLGMLTMAMAAHNNGGIVIAQVERLTKRGTIHPRMVEVPGILVDAVVVDPDQKQNPSKYEPGVTGEVKVPAQEIAPLPYGVDKIIVRRATAELKKGNIVNLGVGIPSHLPSLAAEEGFDGDLTFSLEHGAFGGIPSPETRLFGAHYNPDCIIDSMSIFDFYHGGGLSAAILGFAEIDMEGNVNVSHFGGLFRGPGGLIDIAHKTKKIIFCGALTAGGLETKWENGQLVIIKEGRHKKFTEKVKHVTFSGKSALSKDQEVLYITERAVFKLTDAGITLIEIAPGIDRERDISPYVDFPVSVADDVKQMDASLFDPEGRKTVLR